MKRIAILSPNNNSYSETFIQAHRNFIKGDIHYLYSGWIPTESDRKESLQQYYWNHNSFLRLIKLLLPCFIFNRFFLKSSSDFLKFYLKNEKIEIILAEYGPMGTTNFNIIKDLKLQLIVHFHGFDTSAKQVIIDNKQKYQIMFEYTKNVIAVSNVMKNKLIELGCSKEKVILNPCAPNDKFISIKPNFTKKQFIAIGRFVDKKAPYYLILAFKKVIKKHPNSKLIIAGDGILLNTCKNLTKYYGLEDNIHFPGVITPDEYKTYLGESFAFVQHSVIADNGDMEGMPVTVMEASAAGLPVISTFHAGISDVIIHNKTGLLVAEHDVNGMGENMIKILENIQFAKRLGVAGKKRIKENFSMETHISKIQKLLDDE